MSSLQGQDTYSHSHSQSREQHSSHDTAISGTIGTNGLQFQHSGVGSGGGREGGGGSGPSPRSAGPRSPEEFRLGEGAVLGKHARSGSHGDDGSEVTYVKTSRRRMACQPCRVRKVKCDSVRPSCGFCVSAGSHCVYLDASTDKGGLDPTSALMMKRLNQILEGVNGINAAIRPRGSLADLSQEKCIQGTAAEMLHYPSTIDTTSSTQHVERIHEISKDYLRIPTCNTTADSVLTWPIFQGRYPPEYLIDILLEPPSHKPDQGVWSDTLTIPGGLEPIPDERIPSLIDRFLEDVHTKNPILDVEALVHYGRKAAANGLGWDAPSCLVLLACALGSVAIPFEVSAANQSSIDIHAPGITSSSAFAKEIQQAESCYALACRRLGLLKQTILGAHCYFFSAVYLMYTLRPLPAWNHFCQASTFYQIHSRTLARPSPTSMLDNHLNGMSMTQRRLEQSLYWSCFKSECEMRIELPVPQSTIADIDYPHMFPNPPSHPTEGLGLRQYDSNTLSFGWGDAGQSSNNSKVISEEKSWYYYLTEVALRRIGNRILNTFYSADHNDWIQIKPLIPIAKEFEEQILVWSTNLPPAMQYDKNPTGDFSSNRELSWATWNRLLEMKAWLYQPFLYYAIHTSPAQALADLQDGNNNQHAVFQSLVSEAMECCISTFENRCLRHRHHGIWFDLRSVVTASFTIIAAAKSGHVKVDPAWEGRIRSVIATLAFWEGEALDLVKTRGILEELMAEMGVWGEKGGYVRQ